MSSPVRFELIKLVSRRQMLRRMTGGVVAAALASLGGGSRRLLGARPRERTFDLKPRPGVIPARANAVIQLFMNGGPSQVDLWDPKPALIKHHGRKPPKGIGTPNSELETYGGLMASPFQFARHGQSGIQVSEVLPHLASMVDELAIIRSMHTMTFQHEEALWVMHSGTRQDGRPSLGSWVTFALGSENQNLPAYVALCDPRGLPINGAKSWSNGWMPPIYQGTPLRSEGMPVLNLYPEQLRSDAVRQGRQELLRKLNQEHRRLRPGELELDARIESYELAARMQLAATDALDLSQESEATRKLYGLDDEVTASYGTRCLIARRLVERGVRFVQIFMRGQPWDTHSKSRKQIGKCCAETDLPAAGLLRDLKQRGLLDTTLVTWGGEFGRQPVSQDGDGRDHNAHAFTSVLVGGGIKGGQVYGATDDFGYKGVENPVGVPDLHATMLHLLGLDHRRLTLPYDGRTQRLTDVHEARVITDLLA